MANIAVIIGSSIGSFIAAILTLFLIYKYCFKQKEKHDSDKVKEEYRIKDNINLNCDEIEQSSRKELYIEKEEINFNKTNIKCIEKEIEIYAESHIDKNEECKIENFKSKKSKIKFKKKNTILNSYNNAISSGNTCQAEDKTFTEINKTKLIAEQLRKSIIDCNKKDVISEIDKYHHNNNCNDNKVKFDLKLEDQFADTNKAKNIKYNELEREHYDVDTKEKEYGIYENHKYKDYKENIEFESNLKNKDDIISKVKKIDIRILRENSSLKDELMKKYIDSILKSCKTGNSQISQNTDLEIIYSEGCDCDDT